MIIDSFQAKNLMILWQTLLLGILGNILILLGLAGKRYYYAKVIADFNKKLKGKMFAAFLYDNQLSDKDILSDLENDVKQIEENIDVFCSVFPIIIGGFMTYYGKLTPASFVAIYLVSYNIGYQFQELSYFINTRKSSKNLCDKYQFLAESKNREEKVVIKNCFPIQFERVSFSHQGKVILSDFSFTIHSGEKIAIIGESGSGKTTLLNLLFGFLKPDSGQITFNRKDLNPETRQQIGSYILQESHYFDNLSFYDNISLGEPLHSEKMKEILSKVHLLYLKDKKEISNQTLSGGEKQRLEIARSLYHEKDFILADEVKSNLDSRTAKEIEDVLFSLPQTVIEVIHHYSDETLKRYDKVIEL